MRWRPDGVRGRDRGVSAVIGFVLIFGILVITFSLYQAQVVPQQNSEVEFEQHQKIQQQMVELRSNIVSMQGSASTLSTTVDLGVRYPSRTIFVNPGPASGSLRTKGASDPDVNFTLRNVTATDSDETGDFWDGTKLNYSTSIIEYEPDFNRFQGGLPVVYEHSLIYNRVENGNSVPITDQSLINDNRINLIALNGTLAEGGVGAESVDLEPVSTRTRVVEVNNKSGPITLEFASMLNAEFWSEALENELVENGGHVQGVTSSPSNSDGFASVKLELEPGPNRDYELKLSKVGLGTGAANTTAEYLTEVEGAGTTVPVGSTQKLTVEARDQFNGPQSDVTVNASAEGGTVNNNRATDSKGQATFIYRPNSLGDNDIEFSINSDGHDRSTPEDVTISVTVTSGSGGGGGGGGGNAGVGQGGRESYSEKNKSEKFSVPNGRWVGITCTDQLSLSNGQPASRPSGDGDVIRLTALLNDSEGEKYTIDIKLARKLDSSGEFNTKKVEIYDGNGNEKSAKLKKAAAKRIYGDGETDMLDLSNYDDPDTGQGSFSDFVNRTQKLEKNKPVAWQTSRMTGRVDVTLACDSQSKSNFTEDRTLAYESKSNNELSVINGTGGEIRTPVQTNIDALGEPAVGLNSAGDAAFPYVNNSDALKLTDIDGNTETLVNSSSGQSPKPSKTIMATGVWNGSDKSVFYAGTGGSKLYRVAPGGSPTVVESPGNSIKGVVGIGNIDGDNKTELVFVDGSDQVRYLKQNGTIEKLNKAGVGSSNGIGAGDVLQLDGKTWVVIVDGSQNLALVTDDGGNQKQIIQTDNKPKKLPPTAADVDSDGETELVYIGNNGRLKYVDNPLNSPTTKRIDDPNGNKVQPSKAPGVVSP